MDKRLSLALLTTALFLVIGIAASGQSKPPASPPSKKKSAEETVGKQAYSANCAGCHGLDGKGGERAPDIVTRPQVRQLSDEALLHVLQTGVPNTSMPSFRFLDAKTRNELVVHLRTLQGSTTIAKLPGDARRGREIFLHKGGCANCHMVGGEGGFFASELSGYARGRSQESVRDAIVSPNRDLDPRRRTVVATLANGSSLEGIARNEDNFSLQLITPDGAFHLLSKTSLASLTYRDQSPMPANYGTKLSSAELDDLVNFLFSLAEEKSNRNAKDESEED
jgi:putative heme-binding domain-containing protein